MGNTSIQAASYFAHRSSLTRVCALMGLLALLYMGMQKAQAACVSSKALRYRAQPVALYLWSPRMVSSVLEAPQAFQAAQLNGALFVPALNPDVPMSEALAALAHQPAARAVLSPVRYACRSYLPLHALDHAPTIFIFAHGWRHPHRIIGVMPQAAWQSAMHERLIAAPRRHTQSHSLKPKHQAPKHKPRRHRSAKGRH